MRNEFNNRALLLKINSATAVLIIILLGLSTSALSMGSDISNSTQTTNVGAQAVVKAGYYKKISDSTYILALQPGAKLVESLKAFQKATGVLSGSVTGLGVLKNIRLGQYRFVGEPLVNGFNAEATKVSHP